MLLPMLTTLIRKQSLDQLLFLNTIIKLIRWKDIRLLIIAYIKINLIIISWVTLLIGSLHPYIEVSSLSVVGIQKMIISAFPCNEPYIMLSRLIMISKRIYPILKGQITSKSMLPGILNLIIKINHNILSCLI